MQRNKLKYLQKTITLSIFVFIVFSAFIVSSTFARDSQFTRQGAGPMYWITYEHQYGKDVFMPEHRFKDNIDWMAENFLRYGYDMISTDGWIEGVKLLNKNGYVVTHNDRWMSDPIYMDGRENPYLKTGQLFNGDFEYATTESWEVEGNADYGVNKENARDNFKFYFYKDSAYSSSLSQTVTELIEGETYRLSAWVTLEDYSGTNQFTEESIGSHAEMRISQNGEVVDSVSIELSSHSTDYKNYTLDVVGDVTDVTVEFVINSAVGSASLQLDDITFEVFDDEQSMFPEGNLVENGDFEQEETIGWTFEGDFAHGRNNNDDGTKSLYTWNWESNLQNVSQTITELPDGRYYVNARVKAKNGITNAEDDSVVMKISGYDSTKPDASIIKEITNEDNWDRYFENVEVTSGELTIEFIVDPTINGTNSAGIDIDHVSVEYNPWHGYPEERYPDGHTWKHWSDYINEQGMKFGVYYNPMWISPEVVKNPDKYTVVGTDTPVADLIITEEVILESNGWKRQGDRFDGGQGSERALYWLNMDHPDAEAFLKGYVDFFAEQGAEFLRVDFLSWYESGYDHAIGELGLAHTKEQYEKALKWMDEATAENEMFLSLVMPNLTNHGELEQKYGDMIRINEDAFEGGWDHTSGRRQEWQPTWSQWANSFQGFTGFADISGRGSMILDGDFIKLNTFDDSPYADNEKKTTISLLAISGSPVTIADQYDTMGDNYKYYQNPELIELNKLGFVGKPIFNSDEHYKDNISRDSERWAGQLPDGSWVIALFNRTDNQEERSMDFQNELGIEEEVFVRDLWEQEDLGYYTSYSETLEPRASKVLRLVPASTDKVFQAEVASYQGGAIFGNDKEGYDGFGYITGLDNEGSRVTFAVEMPEAGEFSLDINYFSTEESTLTLSVEDVQINVIDTPKTVTFPSTGEEWGTAQESVELSQGVNIVTLEFTGEDTGSALIDSIQFEGFTDQIVNGNFESGDFTGWDVTGSNAGVDSYDVYSGQYKAYFWSDESYQQKIEQDISDLEDGTYTVTAMVKQNTGTPSLSRMELTNYGGDNVYVDIPHGNDYVKISGIVDVTDGSLNIAFYQDAPGFTNLQIDHVRLKSEDFDEPEVKLYNNRFEQGFHYWSRNNMINQSIQTEEDGNSFVQIAGKEAYSSDLWQFANAPVEGTYEITLNTRRSGSFDKASVYVSYSGGVKEVSIPPSFYWYEVKIPNIQLKNGEVVKVGIITDGQAESELDVDDVKIVKTDSTAYQEVTSIESLNDETPYTVSEDEKSIVLNAENDEKVKIEFVHEDTAKVWMDPTGTFTKDDSFVVNQEEANVVPAVSDAEDYILIQTEKMSMRAYKDPFKISYYDAANTELWTEHSEGEGLGYDGASGVYASMNLDPNEHFFGLGVDRDSQSFDRRGHKVVMRNDMKSGYGGNTSNISGNFFTSTRGYGLYFDNTYENVTFDMGATDSGTYSFSAPNGEMLYYFMAGEEEDSLTSILQSFADLTGTPPMPPQWALGYIQSKFGYKSWEEVNNIVDTFRDKEIPLDSVILDVYWTEKNHYFDMTWSEAFANPEQNMLELADKGISIVPIVDPYIQLTANNFDEGDEMGFFVSDFSGNSVIYNAWYGPSGLVDFTNPDAVDWFNAQVKTLYDAGVKGYWIDLNEPEIFTDPLRDQFYKGKAGEIRNVYASHEAKSFYDGQRSYSNDRVWLLSRSGFSGIQEYGATIWTGDIDSSWEAFTHNMQLGLSSSMSGMPYFTTDIGGFYGKPSPELYTRWMQAGAFMPIYRSHNCECEDPTNSREPWIFGEEAEGIVKEAIQQRYQLLPYIYSATQQTTTGGNVSLMRPLVIDYTTDVNVYGIEDQWMFGPSMLVAPVAEESATNRNVYLPEGTWYDWSTHETFTGGQSINYDVDLSTTPVFVKEGAIIPTREYQNYTGERPATEISLKAYPKQSGEASSFTLYEDDGQTYEYENGQSTNTNFTMASNEDSVTLEIAAMNGNFDGKIENRTWVAEIKVNANGDEEVNSVERNGNELTLVDSKTAVEAGNDVWYYDTDTDMLYVRTAEVPTSESQVISINKSEQGGK
ncbi:TIM-barrel domain-containing protein [Halalkalibacter lacteus]|uniref:TIM-barrel domain-containing protein n=1 Tax=Halalkalibacter lacteus TaxID=3090663 RepID=UPI002FCC7936